MPQYKEELHHKTELSERLLKLREEHHLSKREMGAIAGKSLSSWHNYETGIIEPPVSVLQRICDHFGITLESLTGDEALPEEKPGKKPLREKKKEEKPEKVRAKKGEEKKAEKVAAEEEALEEREESPEEPQPTIVLQSLVGGSISAEEILKRVEAVAPQAEEIYVKTEENRIYWTGGGASGSVVIWE